MQQHLSLINKHVNTVKDVPAREFIKVWAKHLKQLNKFKIPDVSHSVSHFSARPRVLVGASNLLSVLIKIILYLIVVPNR